MNTKKDKKKRSLLKSNNFRSVHFYLRWYENGILGLLPIPTKR